MTAVALLDSAGSTVGRASVAAELAEQDIKPHLIHETVVAELAADRAGTHSTLTRSDVRGGGRKPWRQKGTGRARQGSIRAPQWTGGGVVFGPTPRSYGGKVNRKIRRQAFLGALRAHVERGSVAIMEPTGWDAPSTKRAAAYLAAAPERLADRPLLVVVEDAAGVEALSFRNLAGVTVIETVELRTAEAMSFRALLIERAAWEALAGELGDTEKVSGSVRTAAEVLAEREEADRAVRQEKQAARAARLEERRAKEAAEASAAPAPAAAEPAPEPEPEPEPAEEPGAETAEAPEAAAEETPAAEADATDETEADETEADETEAEEESADDADDAAADEDEEDKA